MCRPTRLAIFPLLALALAGCQGLSSPTDPVAETAVAAGSVEGELVALINDSRAEAGLLPLADDYGLQDVARRHSQAMRDKGFLGHVGPDGTTLADRLRSAGVAYSAAGENVAQMGDAAGVARQAHRMLMESPEHRRNILHTDFSLVGVGVATGAQGCWITEVFIRP